MTSTFAFLKKELTESIRSYRLPILLLVFFVFGVISPLGAKLTPEIIEMALPENATIIFPEPTVMDSWMQFYKNVSQMGLIVTLIIFSGVMAGETAKGTLIILLAKGLTRRNVILSKAACMALIWTACLALSFVTAWGYTEYLFRPDGIANLAFSVFCLWLFGVFLLSLLTLSAAATKNGYACLLITGGAAAAGMLINIFPNAFRYNPLTLAARSMDLLSGALSPQSIIPAVWISAGLTALSLAAAVFIFKKRQL